MGHVRAWAAREAVPTDRCRPQAAGRGDGHLAPVLCRCVEAPVRAMRRSLRSSLWHVPLDQEVDEELAFHIDMRTRELVGRGLAPKDAREIAIRRLGDVATVKRACVKLGRKRDREMRLTR